MLYMKHPNVVNYQSLPTGASSRQIKLRRMDFFRGSLEQLFLHQHFCLFTCSDCLKIHLNMQMPLKILELCSSSLKTTTDFLHIFLRCANVYFHVT